MKDAKIQPNLFLVGAAKSGTSSLFYYLKQHPEICMADEQRAIEPACFADYTGLDDLEEYLDLFSHHNSEKVIGEKSTAYLFDPNAAARIHSFNPDAKIIIILRDPVDMAYSYFNHNRARGYEPINSFARALEAEEKRAADPKFPTDSNGYYANFLYRRRATYYPQVKRYFDVFAPEKILLLKFSELKRDTLGVYRKVLEFLEVDPAFKPDLERRNVGGTMRLHLLEKLYTGIAPLRSLIRAVVPDRLRKAVLSWNRSGGRYQELTAEERARYRRLFEGDVAKMREAFGIELFEDASNTFDC